MVIVLYDCRHRAYLSGGPANCCARRGIGASFREGFSTGSFMKRGLRIVLLVAASIIGDAARAETIERALARAYENNPQLSAERATVRQADEGVAQALSGYRPTINATANLGTQYTDTTVVVPPQPNQGTVATPGPSSRNLTANFRGQTTPRGAGLNLSET